jgi:hypothetical protein
MSQPPPPLPPPSTVRLPRPWQQMSPAQQQQLAQHWARLLQQIQRPIGKEKPHADDLLR